MATAGTIGGLVIHALPPPGKELVSCPSITRKAC